VLKSDRRVVLSSQATLKGDAEPCIFFVTFLFLFEPGIYGPYEKFRKVVEEKIYVL
jgi:hypothetical protein